MKLERFIRAQTPLARRDILSLLVSGQIKVNGQRAEQLTQWIDPKKDTVHVRGEKLKSIVRFETYLFYKPRGVITTMKDPKGRRCIGDYVSDLSTYVFPVGRLDRATTGLLILTNDGEFAQEIAHPSGGWVKTYKVTLDQRLKPSDMERLCEGVLLTDGPASFSDLEVLSSVSVRVKIHEGRNRIVRRLFEQLGYQVVKLHRECVGSFTLKGLAVGEIRKLKLGKGGKPVA